MANENKHTSEDAATAASKVLRDGRTAADSKTCRRQRTFASGEKYE